MTLALLLLACGGSDSSTVGGDTAGSEGDVFGNDTATDSGPPGESCAETPSPPETRTGAQPRPAVRLDGTVTWTLRFDDTARAAGSRDCSYRRVYEDFREVTDVGWLCPSCSWMAVGEARIVEGFEDCYLQISSGEARRPELLGLGADPAHFWRSAGQNLSLGDMGATSGDPEGSFSVAWSDESTLEAGGSFTLEAEGSFTASFGAEIVEDPADPREEPFSCGWPRNDPGGALPPWALVTGQPFPNPRLPDACEEGVSLRDLRGFYVVVDVSAPDCGPCQAMAAEAEAFKARMDAACLPVELVTLLVGGLSQVNGTASREVREDWARAYGLTSPVLGDRGFGYALFPTWLGRDSGMSFPSIAVVAPDGTLLGGQSGFGGWETIEGLIANHAGISPP